MGVANNILINDKPVFYQIEGQGQTVVLVHGFSEDGTIWENQVEYLKGKCQLIIPDLPGSGQSPINETPWSMEYFAECIRAILDHENISTVQMIGHSMGGMIACTYSGIRPQRVARLVSMEGYGGKRLDASAAPKRYERWLSQLLVEGLLAR